MRTSIRLKLDMAGRAVEFVRAHPDDNPATALVGTRLTDLVDRADQLLQQQRAQQLAAASALSLKAGLRDNIEESYGALVGIARAAAREHPDVAVHRRMPRHRTNEATFVTTARVAAAEAATVMEQLGPYGLTPGLLGTINGDLDAYEAAVSRQRSATAGHVGTGAELAAVVEDIMGVVRNLDALYRVRFRAQPELRAAWKSARNVAWRVPEGEASAGAGEEQGARAA